MTVKVTDPVYFLLVDDLEENLMSLEALLRREGLIMLKARSGTEALELLLKHEVALALLDVQMPGMDGFELAELMRGTAKTRRVPIIFLTAGTADRQRRFRGYEAGAVDFLYKPIEPDILRSKSDVFYSLYRQQQQLEAQRDALQLTSAENVRLLEESRQYADALKEADRRKDEFLATLAHELRNPLAPIRNGLRILRMNADEKTSDGNRDMMGMMDRQLTHLVRLIDDLLDVSRVSEGKIDLRREDIRVADALEAAVEASRPLIEEGRHSLSVDMPAGDLWLNADITRVSQIVSNLLNNAAKYTPPGGRIVLSVRPRGEMLSITVADNGLGIPADMLPRVFDLFTQVDHNLDRSQGGLGIGLALVRRLVTMHGGTIRAESEGQGLGSAFTVELPLIEAPCATAPVAVAPVAGAGSPAAALDILVVDDNVPSAQTMGWMLEMIGHRPVLAHDGLEAIEVAKNMQPDVILLDIGMPGMSGYDVCRELRKDPAFKDALFVAQTGWGQERDRQQAFEAGFHHHLVKPVSFEKFTALLADVRPAVK